MTRSESEDIERLGREYRETVYAAIQAARAVAATAKDYEVIAAQCESIAGYLDVDDIWSEAVQQIEALAGKPDLDEVITKRAVARARGWKMFLIISAIVVIPVVLVGVRAMQESRKLNARYERVLTQNQYALEQYGQPEFRQAEQLRVQGKRREACIRLEFAAREAEKRKLAEAEEQWKRAAEEKERKRQAEEAERKLLAEAKERQRLAAEAAARKGAAEAAERKRLAAVAAAKATSAQGGDGVRKAGETISVDIGGGERMAFVWIPAGTFIRGSVASNGFDFDAPPHRVVLTKGGWIGKYEVTQKQWESVTGNNPSQFKSASNPVENVSWDECQAFISMLNRTNGAYRFRLPTEAEWEYACRAGATTKFNTGDSDTDLARAAWIGLQAQWKTHPVGEKSPNRWGLYDMHGNVGEWCSDYYGAYPSGTVTNPTGARAGGISDARVVRGQTWADKDPSARGCGRQLAQGVQSHVRSNCYGLRLVCERRVASSNAPVAVDARPDDRPAAAVVARDTVSARVSMASPVSGKPITVNLGGGTTMELVWCPPGRFLMGSPAGELGRGSDETQHEVTLTQGFWLGRHEVTQAQWTRVMGIRNPSMGGSGPDLPVNGVSWDRCQAFIGLLNGTNLAYRFRLPTEAEWEYACRAGTTGPFAGTEDLDQMGWYRHEGEQGGKARPVGQKRWNAWGLHDMHGNVEEWCADLYGVYPTGSVTNSTGSVVGMDRVIRGGGWYDGPPACRSAARSHAPPNTGSNTRGFRLAFAGAQAGDPSFSPTVSGKAGKAGGSLSGGAGHP